MRGRQVAIAALVASVTTVGCATTMAVSSHVERGLDFSRYHSFSWGPADALPKGDPRLDNDPFYKDHVLGAVEKQLAKRGFELTTTGAADLLIHYHANIRKRFAIDRGAQAYDSCNGANCPPETIAYEEGTLVLDFIDARTNRLVWRGWARNTVEDTLRNRDKMARRVDQAVTEMLKRLPPH
jgi:hypothetical protein